MRLLSFQIVMLSFRIWMNFISIRFLDVQSSSLCKWPTHNQQSTVFAICILKQPGWATKSNLFIYFAFIICCLFSYGAGGLECEMKKSFSIFRWSFASSTMWKKLFNFSTHKLNSMLFFSVLNPLSPPSLNYSWFLSKIITLESIDESPLSRTCMCVLALWTAKSLSQASMWPDLFTQLRRITYNVDVGCVIWCEQKLLHRKRLKIDDSFIISLFSFFFSLPSHLN